MDEWLSGLVAPAKTIRESGRWKALNARVEAVCANPGKDNAWWIHVIASIAAQNFSEFCSIERAYDNGQDAALLAWRARNLLEISVWAIYATRTRNNARRLYEDAGRDIRGIYDAFSKWGDRTHQGDVYRAAKVELATNAKLLGGIDSIEGKYKPVAEAADELGLGEYYSVIYKLLSKFAHPTAMLMLGNIDAEKRRLQRGFFYGQGCLQFTTAFSELERTLALAS